MKILKSKKALSPVVASIILIAVTVAVSLAVGGYMFGLFDVFKGESVKISNISFINSNPKTINMTFANLGTAMVSIKTIEYNAGSGWQTAATTTVLPVNIDGNKPATITCSIDWQPGTVYDFRATTAKGTALSQTQVAS